MPKESWNGKRECSASHRQPVSAFLPGKWKAHDPWSVRRVSVHNTEISSRASSCLSTVHTSICGGGSHTIIQEHDSSFIKSSHHPCFPYEQAKAQRLAMGHLPYLAHEGRFQPWQLCAQGEFNCLTIRETLSVNLLALDQISFGSLRWLTPRATTVDNDYYLEVTDVPARPSTLGQGSTHL